MPTPDPRALIYAPELPPQDPAKLPGFLLLELQKIQAALVVLSKKKFDELHREPDRPRRGDLALADGTDWNPGSGAGLYAYSGAAWVLLLNL